MTDPAGEEVIETTANSNVTMVTLVSRDKKIFELPKAAAVLAEMVKNTINLEDEDEDEKPDNYAPVEVLRVDADCLEKVVEFLVHYEKEPLPKIQQPLNADATSLEEVRLSKEVEAYEKLVVRIRHIVSP